MLQLRAGCAGVRGHSGGGRENERQSKGGQEKVWWQERLGKGEGKQGQSTAGDGTAVASKVGEKG